MQYISAKEASEKLNSSQKSINELCMENLISGVEMVDNMWLLPKDTVKPDDLNQIYSKKSRKKLRPFVKWAGGKGQLLDYIRKTYPIELGKTINKYAEPFVGGGAILFDILSKYDLNEVYISDINTELIGTYNIIRDNVSELLEMLEVMQTTYNSIDQNNRKTYYYKMRELFNKLKLENHEINNIEKASLFIFLNKTCFNGLYRVNKKGEFNVPMGKYKNPCICDKENLIEISKSLKKVKIICADYRKSYDFIDKNTLVYFDPPYRPLSDTASFTSYTKNVFSDNDQIQLAQFISEINKVGAKIIVSNSDPKNTNINDDFFDNLYNHYQIRRVNAKRMINCVGKSRGKINELLITNY